MLGAALAAGIVLARSLGPSGRGEVAALLLWASIGYDIGALGTPQAVAYFASNPTVLGGPAQALRIAARAFPLLLMVAVCVFTAMFLTGSGLNHWPWAVMVFWIALRLASAFLNRQAQGLRRIAVFNWGRAIAEASPVIGFVAVAAVGSLSGMSALIVYSVALGASALFTGILLRPRRARVAVRYPGRDRRALFWRYSRWNLSSIIALKINRSIDLLILTVVASPDAVGTYAVAAASATAIAVFGTSFGLDLFSRMAQHWDTRLELTRRYLVGQLGLACAAALSVILFAPRLIPAIYGEAFGGAVRPAQILAIGAVALSSSQLLSDALRALGSPRSVTATQLAGGATTLLGIALFGTQLEVVALAASAGYAVTAASQYIVTLRSMPTGAHRNDHSGVQSLDQGWDR